MATTMILEDAQKVLEKLGYAKAGKFSVKQAQQKIDEVLENPDDFEADAKKVKEKEIKKLIDTIWDAVDDEDEIEVVEAEEEEDEDEDEEEEASDDEEEDEDEEEEDEPKRGKKAGKKAAKASKNGKAKRQPPQRSVERDEFNRSVNSGSHVINQVLLRAKEPLTLGEIEKEAKKVGKELGIKPRPTIGRYLQRMIRLEQLEADGRGDDRTFVLADGKPRKAKKVAKKSKGDDDDDKPAKKAGKKKAKAKK